MSVSSSASRRQQVDTHARQGVLPPVGPGGQRQQPRGAQLVQALAHLPRGAAVAAHLAHVVDGEKTEAAVQRMACVGIGQTVAEVEQPFQQLPEGIESLAAFLGRYVAGDGGRVLVAGIHRAPGLHHRPGAGIGFGGKLFVVKMAGVAEAQAVAQDELAAVELCPDDAREVVRRHEGSPAGVARQPVGASGGHVRGGLSAEGAEAEAHDVGLLAACHVEHGA